MVGEIIAGELVATPRPSSRHTHTSSSLGGELFGPYQKSRGGPGGWVIWDEPELHLGGHVLVPDLAGWRKERLHHSSESHGITVAPDWVCEVISPSSMRTDRVLKMPRYAECGVHYLWLVDPVLKILEAYKLEAGRWTLLSNHSGDDKIRVEPFHEIELDLAGLWWD
jgi:Uma2 family endonuclease